MRILAVLLMMVAPYLSTAAHAQMTASQIARCLKPGASMSDCSTRGVREGNSAPSYAVSPATPPFHRTPPVHREAALTIAPTPQPLPSSVQAPATGPDLNLTVLFDTGSATMAPEGVAQINELGKAILSLGVEAYRYRIEGHTDTVGSRRGNDLLSQRRADTVKTYLQTTFRIDPGRLTAVGLGQNELLVETGDNVAEPRNRRVRVVNVGQ